MNTDSVLYDTIYIIRFLIVNSEQNICTLLIVTNLIDNFTSDPVVEYDNLDMDMYNFYNGSGVNRKCVHCTAYFCRRGKHPAHDVYSEKVKLCMGKMYSLLVTGD